MSDEKMNWYYKQPNYGMVCNDDYWTIEEGIKYIVKYALKDRSWNDKEKAENEFSERYQQILKSIKKSVIESKLAIKRVYYQDLDEYAQPYDALDYENSTVTPYNLIIWALKNRLNIPMQFKDMVFTQLKSEFKIWENENSTLSEQTISSVSDIKTSNASNAQVNSELTDVDTNKSNMIIDAAVKAVLYCVNNNADITITKDDLRAELVSYDIKNAPVEDIFRLIPEYLRHSDKGGSPKKLLDKTIEHSFLAGIYYAKNKKISLTDLAGKIKSKLGTAPRNDIMAKIYHCVQEGHDASE